ncbi:NADAR family protein [Dactylosporangium cerinum]|uniref:NADAR family protein n=1 Tax=Dactylosporangium cerinum TaxID=1434730 RepID=A0ABV9VX67_9ACTN
MPALTDPPADTAALIELMASGARVRFLHFWKHDTEPGGPVGRGSLSQWAPIGFAVDGVRFATAEHYMMWSKAELFGDTATAAKILAAGHPGEVKALGREVRGFDETIWKRERFGIVVAGSEAKFGQRDDLREFLVGTGDRILVEASPLDRIWGIGLSAQDASADEPALWRGLNLLGFALMRARTTLASA